MSSISFELVWLRWLLLELDVLGDDSIPLFGDNTSAINIATNPIHHECTKHIEVDCHCIRELVHDKVLRLIHVLSCDQVVDLFTKPIMFARHEYLISKLMLVDNHHQFEGGCQTEQIWPTIKEENFMSNNEDLVVN